MTESERSPAAGNKIIDGLKDAIDGKRGFDPGMPWRIARWNERCGIVLFNVIVWGVITPAMFLGILYFVGMAIDGITLQNVEHDRCLKRATNGYEIERCH